MPLGKGINNDIKELYADNRRGGKARGSNGKKRSRAQIIAIALASNRKKKKKKKPTKMARGGKVSSGHSRMCKRRY